LSASTGKLTHMVLERVHLPRLVSTQPSTTRLLPEGQPRLRARSSLSVTGGAALAAALFIQSVQAGLFAFKLRSITSMAERVALDKAWADTPKNRK